MYARTPILGWSFELKRKYSTVTSFYVKLQYSLFVVATYVFNYQNPVRRDPFLDPPNTTEQTKVSSEHLMVVFVGSHTLARMWKLRSAVDCTSSSLGELRPTGARDRISSISCVHTSWGRYVCILSRGGLQYLFIL